MPTNYRASIRYPLPHQHLSGIPSEITQKRRVISRVWQVDGIAMVPKFQRNQKVRVFSRNFLPTNFSLETVGEIIAERSDLGLYWVSFPHEHELVDQDGEPTWRSMGGNRDRRVRFAELVERDMVETEILHRFHDLTWGYTDRLKEMDARMETAHGDAFLLLEKEKKGMERQHLKRLSNIILRLETASGRSDIQTMSSYFHNSEGCIPFQSSKFAADPYQSWEWTKHTILMAWFEIDPVEEE